MSYNMQYQPPQHLQTTDEKQMGLFLHLSLLVYTFVFPIGAIAPILIWQLKKDQIPALKAHGKMVTNWMISLAIYFFISLVLSIVLVGLLGFLVFGLLAVIFPIIGAIKANNGELWEYPLTIKFLK